MASCLQIGGFSAKSSSPTDNSGVVQGRGVGRAAHPEQSAEPGSRGGEAVRGPLAGRAGQNQGAQFCAVWRGVSRRATQGPVASGTVSIPAYM